MDERLQTQGPELASASDVDVPFHAGERALQARTGVAERLTEVGDRVMRDWMPEQHREFFAQLPFVLVGSVDAQQRPWTSVLSNPPGFIHSPDPQHLVLQAHPLPGDPLADNLRVGAPLGLLGIEPHTRRRNRMNGRIVAVADGQFTVHVDQSFGNCPKYIQARGAQFEPRIAGAPSAIHRSTQLDAAARKLIAAADTFYIASMHPAAGTDGSRAHGVDVSHRGGKPGFVRIDDARRLTVPDFVGNFFFNTLGNLALHPKAGVLFMDFADGGLLYLSTDAEIIWAGPEVAAFAGAQRLLRLRVTEMIRTEATLPLRWTAAQMSPFLTGTGDWSDRSQN